MYECVRFVLPRWHRPRSGALFRYGLVDRVRRCSESHHMTVIAFGYETIGALRCVLHGPPRRLGPILKAVKVGTALSLRHAGMSGGLEVAERTRSARRALDAVVWAHEAPLQGRRSPTHPLATPWSSHRDLLGFREAVFFDAAPLREAVDADEVTRRCGGGGPPPRGNGGPWALATLLRVAAAVIGVVPADRRCFALFVHLALAREWSIRDIARALCLTPRRVRQIKTTPVPHLPIAQRVLADPRLQRVP